MATNQVMKHCRKCGKITQHFEPSTSHVLHLLLSVISIGFWIPVWFIVTYNNRTKARCTECGKMKGVLG